MSSRVDTRSRREPSQRETGEPTQSRSRRAGREQAPQHEQENETSKQDAEQRRILRCKYRELKQSITEGAEDLVRLDSNRFNELVGKMDDLHKEVHKPREQIADAEAVLDITSSFLVSVKGSMRKSGVSPAVFVGAILANFGKRTAGDEEEAVNIDWGRLGLAATGFLPEAPGLSTMLGPMNIEPKVRQAHAPRAKRVRPTENARPEEVRDQGEEAAKSETDANMETMFAILRSVKRARLDSLVLNRQSFSQTVENIFSLSFLVKDGRVAITFDKDGTHFVAPKNAPKADERQSGQVTNTQFVFRYDWACWQVMQDNLEPGSELMPDRQNTIEPEPQPPTQRTPIRKNSRNRGRETRKMSAPEDQDGEGESEDNLAGRCKTKRSRTLLDQFR